MERLDLNQSIEMLNLPEKTFKMLMRVGIDTLNEAIRFVYRSQDELFGETILAQDTRVSLEDHGIDWKKEYWRALDEAAKDQA